MKFISVSGQAHRKFCSVTVLTFLLFEGIKAIYLPCVGVGWISLGRAHFFFFLFFLKPFSSKAHWRTNLGEVPPSFIQLKSEENWDLWVYPDLAEEWFHLLGVFQDNEAAPGVFLSIAHSNIWDWAGTSAGPSSPHCWGTEERIVLSKTGKQIQAQNWD